jgi:mannose-1-phosphate guanylyltransferase
MLVFFSRQPQNYRLIQSATRNMSGGVSYAAAVSTPNGSVRQPQIQSRACSDPDLQTSFESQASKQPQTKPQRPGAGIRSKTSFRGWTSKKGQESQGHHERGPIKEVHHGHITRAEHQPNTGGNEEHVYVLTMKLEDSLSVPMNKLRQQYFPKRLNRTPAHLTLFHALPHSHMEAIEQGLSQLSSSTKPFHVTTGGPFRMRKGVGVNVDAGYQDMKGVHNQLKTQWMSFLSEQDQGGFRPHWTVMNKVDEETEVEHALGAVRKELSHDTKEGRAVGLELWRYDRGNWIWANEYTFGTSKEAPSTSSPGGGSVSPKNASPGEQPGSGPSKRPGMSKRGSSVAGAWRSMSFRRKS